MKKISVLLLTAAVFSLVLIGSSSAAVSLENIVQSIPTSAGRWVQYEDGRWAHINSDYSYTTDNWQQIEGKWYYFDADGYMLADTTTPDGNLVGADGVWIENNETFAEGQNSAVGGETDKSKAFAAYYDFLKAEIANNGKPIRERDLLGMYSNKVKNVRDGRILYAYLLDVTGDGVEELIIKKIINAESEYVTDSKDKEWIGVYTFDNGSIRRIGQTLYWGNIVSTGGSYSSQAWTEYKPAGYIGDINSSVEYPYILDDHLYYCVGDGGKIYLADENPDYLKHFQGTDFVINFYAYNGSVMQDVGDRFEIRFPRLWYSGSLHSNYGNVVYYRNGTRLELTEIDAAVDPYISGGITELVNGDYSAVLQRLSEGR